MFAIYNGIGFNISFINKTVQYIHILFYKKCNVSISRLISHTCFCLLKICSFIIPEKYIQFIQDWKKDDEKFIKTTATEKMEKYLNDFDCVVVVGNSGNGKSAIIRHIALKLNQDSDHVIIPSVVDPSDILQLVDKQERNQVFVVDDFCGKEVLNPHTAFMWSSQIDDIINVIKTQELPVKHVKFLFSVGREIYDDNVFQHFESLEKYVVMLSDFPLNEDEKIKMIHEYIPSQMKLKETYGFNTDYFPVLCKIAEGKSAEQIMNLFENLDDFIKTELFDIHKKNSLQYYLILYCALFNDHFKATILDGVFSSEHEKTAFYNLCMEFHYGLYKKSAGVRLKECLRGLEFGYVRQTDDFIHFIHRKVYQVAAIISGQSFVDCFIKFASHSFIAENYRFESITLEKKGQFIWIKDEEKENRYFDRLMTDLEGGLTYSSFHNSQLYNTSYRKLFCAYCYNRKQKVIALLYKLEETNQSQLRNECEEYEQDYEDYINFEKQYHFSSHKMRQPILESAWEGYGDIIKLLITMELDVNKKDRFGRSALIVASHHGKTDVVKILLENKADYAILDNKRQSALLAASRKGHTKIVKLLLEKNADTSVRDLEGFTPVLAACEGGHTVVAHMLFETGADVSVCDNIGQSSLFLACLHNCEDFVNYLIHTSDKLLNKCNKKGMSPLSNACMKGNVKIVNLLLEAKANIETKDCEGRTPLFIACQEGQHKVVDILVKIGADVMTCDWHKHTLLTIACENGHSKIVKTLLELNSSLINKISEDSRSPLFIASEKGYLNIVDTLLKNNADIEKQDNEKRTPFYVACRFNRLQVAELLCERGANINTCNKWGGSPLFAACREGHQDVVQFLINNNTNFVEDENETTPLLVACEEGYTKIAKLLIDKEAGINTCNKEGKYPLHSAAFGGHTDIVKALIDKAADKSVKDSEKHTSLDIARIRRFSDIENMLRVCDK